MIHYIYTHYYTLHPHFPRNHLSNTSTKLLKKTRLDVAMASFGGGPRVTGVADRTGPMGTGAAGTAGCGAVERSSSGKLKIIENSS